MMFFNKSNQIIKQLDLHAQSVMACYKKYQSSVLEIVNKQSNNVLSNTDKDELVQDIISLEETADMIRHQVIRELLQGGLLVDSRKTTMRIIEGIDSVADIAEDVIQMICYENINLSDLISQPIQEINALTRSQLELLIDVLRQMVTKYDIDVVLSQIEDIENLESKVDAIENNLIREIFDSEMDLASKLHYKQLIRLITSMSDVIEDLSDEVEIILASRRI